MVSDELNRSIASLERLPALPAAVMRATRLCSDPNASAASIEQVFRSDEGLAASVLRRANSVAAGGTSQRRFGLREAIARLGNKSLLRIAVEHGAASRLKDGGRCYGLDRGELWRSSLGGAAVAERIALDSRMADADLAFSAALVRDIGKLALDALAGGERANSWAELDDRRSFVEVERRRFGIDHAELGALLAERWSMPSEVGRAIRHHHAPIETPVDRVCDVVHAADCVARWSGLGVGDDGMLHPLQPRVREQLALTRDRVEQLALHALEAVRDAAAEADPARRCA